MLDEGGADTGGTAFVVNLVSSGALVEKESDSEERRAGSGRAYR